MYLHLGGDTVVPQSSIIAVFDLDNTTWSYLTRDYLTRAEKDGRVKNVSGDLPKAFVVCTEPDGSQTVYLSQLNPATLSKRAETMSLE